MDEKIKTGEHYACVIKVGKYVDFVIVEEFSDGTEIPYMYELKQGEELALTNPPTMKVNADSVGFIKPLWDGKEWTESATADEIRQWNKEHPAPKPQSQEETVKLVRISREDFDLLDVTHKDTIYYVTEEDGTITITEGED